jgi:hypothetical protein
MGAHLIQFFPWLRHLPSRWVQSHFDLNRTTEKSYKSLAKWKRDAEDGYRQDTAMFESLFHMVEANVVRMCHVCLKPLLTRFRLYRRREMIIKVWQQH